MNNKKKEQKKKEEKMKIISSVQMEGMIPPEATIMNKITEDHITEYIHGVRKEMENTFDERRQNRIFIFLMLIVIMIFFVVIILLLKDKPDFMEKIIYSFANLVVGVISGYGLGKNKSKNE